MNKFLTQKLFNPGGTIAIAKEWGNQGP
jgi:hypothetical protein